MDRRDFLATAVGVPALVSVSEGRRAQTPSPSVPAGLKLGTVTYNIAKDWDVPTLIKNLTEVGFDAVELRTTHKHGVEIALSPAARAEVRKQFEDSPVKIGGLGTTCEYPLADPAVVRKNIDETKEWVKLAQDIGSPGVKVRPNGLPKEVPEEKTLEQIGKALAECGAFAQDHGVKIQLEVHGTGTSRLPRIRKILDYGGNHPGVRVCWNSNQDGPARRRIRRELQAGARPDRAGPHARSVSRGVPLAALITSLVRDEVRRLLLRGDPGVSGSDAHAQVLQGAVPRVSGSVRAPVRLDPRRPARIAAAMRKPPSSEEFSQPSGLSPRPGLDSQVLSRREQSLEGSAA